MQKAKQCFSDLVKNFDVFTSPVSLRYEKQPDYNTFTGGCFSIAMIILLISVFFNQWIDILNYAVIYSNQQTVRQFDPSKLLTNTNQFMFAIGVIGIDLNANDTRYFDLSIQAIWVDQNRSQHITKPPLQPCTVDQWSKFGPEFQQTFTRMKLQTFKCPPSDYQLHFQGKYTSANFAYIKITFSKCSGAGCKTATQFRNYISSKTAFFLDIFYTNTLLNKDQLKSTQPVFEDKTYLMTSDSLGINMNIYVSQYEMSTDQTLWPWQDVQVKKGLIVDKNDHQQWNFIPNSPAMSKIYFRKSDNKVYIQRSFRKIDDMLSYIGGLFGLIAIALGVLLTYYSQCSYQLGLSSNIFEYKIEKAQYDDENDDKEDKDKNKIDQIKQVSESSQDKDNNNNIHKPTPSRIKTKQRAKSKHQLRKKMEQDQLLNPSQFHFWDYLRYLVFLTLKSIGCKPKWKKMVMYDDTLDQMRNQMNISTLIQKITFFDKAVHALFDEEQLKLLYLQEKYNIIDIKREREMLDMGFQVLNLFVQNNGKANQSQLNQMLGEMISPVMLNVNNQSQMISKIELMNNHSNLMGESKIMNNSKFRRQSGSTRKLTFRNLSISPFDMLMNVLNNNKESKDQIPKEIKYALDKLKAKISQGDLVSKRIYHGLDPMLIQKYENIKQKQKKNQKIQLQPIAKKRKERKQQSFRNLLGLKKTVSIANQFYE